MWDGYYSVTSVDEVLQILTELTLSQVSKKICYFDQNTQADAIKSFIGNTVIPVIYGTTHTFAIKNISNLVEDNEADFPGCCGGAFNKIYFTIADIEIAVQD